MRLFAVIAALSFSVLVFGADSATAQASTPKKVNEVSKVSETEKSKHVKIQKGDSLSKIAKKQGTTYLRIFYANKQIKNPDLIYPGKSVRIPSTGEKLKKRALPNAAPKPIAKKAQPQRASTRSYTPNPAPAPAPKPTYSSNSGGVWDRLAGCESGGNWSINTGNGYYGGLQFSLSSWRAVGGSGLPSSASKSEQIARAEKLKAIQGWGAWPACTAKLGIR
jgi:LysM repeat protein